MAQTTQFDKLRKQRRRRKRMRRLVTTLLVLGILGVGVLVAAVVYQLDLATQVQNTWASAVTRGEGFPISTRNLQVRGIDTMGRDVVVVADSGVYLYNAKGGLLASRINQYTQPVVRMAGGKLLTYDLGGYSLRVDNKVKQLHALTAPGRIYAADLSQSGHLGVASAPEGFLAQVTIYSPTAQEQYSWYTNDCYITDLRLSPRGDFFCAAGVSSGTDGSLQGQLRFHQTGRDQELAKVVLPGEPVLSMAWVTEGRLQVVTHRGAYLYDKGGSQLAYTPLPQDITHLVHHPQGGLYLAHGDHRSAGGAVVEAYSADLELLGSYATDRRILSLEVDGSRLLILTEGRLLLGDATLSQVQQRRDTDLYYVAATGNMIYGITPQGLIQEDL